MFNYGITEYTDDKLDKEHWQIFLSLLAFGEDYEIVIEEMKERLIDFCCDLEPEELPMLVSYVVTEWFTEQYIELRAEDLYPESYSFICEITQEEAQLIRDGIDDDLTEDFFSTVNDAYSYGGYGEVFFDTFYGAVVLGREEREISIEAAISICLLESLHEEGWCIGWYAGTGDQGYVLTNEPFQSTW